MSTRRGVVPSLGLLPCSVGRRARPGVPLDQYRAQGLPRDHRFIVVEGGGTEACAPSQPVARRGETSGPRARPHGVEKKNGLRSCPDRCCPPRCRPLIPVLDILVPSKGYAVPGHLVVGLAEQLVAFGAAEQGEGRAQDGRIFGDDQERGLCASGPHDTLYPRRSGLAR